jgi:uncharacterized protein YjiS (DUF1127 family)
VIAVRRRFERRRRRLSRFFFSPSEDLAMSTLSLTNDRPAPSFMMALGARIMRLVERRRAINELASLDDRMLSDIGVSRGDIRIVVDGYRY